MSGHTDAQSVGLCCCGCGLPAPIATKTNRSKGHVKGQPVRFINNHHTRCKPSRGLDGPAKLCECGCGLPVPIATHTSRRYGRVKGQPTRFIKGHYARGRRPFAGQPGGNGHLTVPQRLLACAMGLEKEYVIPTARVSSRFQERLPNWYAADLATRETKLAIEVDGYSHTFQQQQARDRRKENVLQTLGWAVLRVTNREVLEDLETVMGHVDAINAAQQRSRRQARPF